MSTQELSKQPRSTSYNEGQWDNVSRAEAALACGPKWSLIPRNIWIGHPSGEVGWSFNTGSTWGHRERTHPSRRKQKENKEITARHFPSGVLAGYPLFYAEASNTSLFRNLSALLLDLCPEHFFFFWEHGLLYLHSTQSPHTSFPYG